MSRQRNKQRSAASPQAGAAILTALLVVALAGLLASSLMGNVARWSDRLTAGRSKAQACALARSALDYAGAILALDARLSAIDTPEEDWARQIPPLQQNEAGTHMAVSGQITDAQGRFPLNNLRRESGVADEQAFQAYRRLLAALDLPEGLAATLADWMDADDTPREGGAESAYYLAERMPLPTGQPLTHLAQLRGIRGYTPEALSRLRGYVNILPGMQDVNVNTAAPEVLHAIQPGLSVEGARALVAARRTLPFRSEPEFRSRLPQPGLPSSLIPLSASSGHFHVDILGQAEEAYCQLHAAMVRSIDHRPPRFLWLDMQ